MQTTVAIIGGGLAGLCLARRLQAAGLSVLVIEARERLGGRILSTDEDGRPSVDGFDLGPSWFWPLAQPDIAALVQELGLPTFPQYDEGDVIFERMSRETPWRCSTAPQAAQSMRIAGGSGALIAALAQDIPMERVWLGASVTGLELREDGVALTTVTADGTETTIAARHVAAAVPPRLLAELAFSPPIDAALARRWRETATWMAPHAKFVAIYDRPFWREAGLCGTAQSFVGPMGEMHDATTASGRAALFGFLGVAADTRASLGENAIRQSCVLQLARLYGPDALTPRATLLKDWAAEPLTATARDRTADGHPLSSAAPWSAGAWENRLVLCGSETSETEPGYMSGAVSAAERAARAILPRLRAHGTPLLP